jgi:hypothetical protein
MGIFIPTLPTARIIRDTALAGTWCAPGIREGGGAGSVVLTVARLGDEP